jgi:hypothetical protein
VSQDITSFMRTVDVGTVWSLLGLQGDPKQSCRCPVHKDKHASFSVYRASKDGRWLWKCHAGCGRGDMADLWMLVTGCGKTEALRELRRNFALNLPAAHSLLPGRVAAPAADESRRLPSLDLYLGTDAEIAELSRLRRLPEAGLRLAIERGLLRFAQHRGVHSWVITDSEGKAISCRPMSGKPWGDGTKALMVKNTQANHLIGLPHVGDSKVVFVCEGGPDLLAAHALARHLADLGLVELASIAVTALLAASVTPVSSTCESMKGKHVVIWAHADMAGIQAAEAWASQFRPYAESVLVFELGALLPEAKDLNDILSHEGGMDLLVASMKGGIHE